MRYETPSSCGIHQANETREVRVSAANKTRDTRSMEERAAGFPPGRNCAMLREDPTPAAFPASSPSAMYWLEGRIEPKEKEELGPSAPETAIEFLMAACASAAEVDFQSVEMVDMRLSTAFSFFLCALHLIPGSDAQTDKQGWDEDAGGCFA